MLTVTIYHHQQGRSLGYQDGQPLVAATSYRLESRPDRDAQTVADRTFEAVNADLADLDAGRDGIDGETIFLAACVYRLLGCRPLSTGDVVYVEHDDASQWLAREPSGWRYISTPSNLDGEPLMADKVYQHLAAQRDRP